MLVSEAIDHIQDIIQNRNATKATRALEWLKSTMNEIDRRTRLTHWALVTYSTPFAITLTKPTCKEILDPISLDTSVAPTYTGVWTVVTTPPDYTQVLPLRFQSSDYQTSQFGIEISSKWQQGMVYVDTIRSLAIPSIVAQSIDLPDMFVYDLAVYGAARHGLIREDDYDRLNWATQKFEQALADFVQWDSRQGIANIRSRMRTQNILGDTLPYPVFPSNYSL